MAKIMLPAQVPSKKNGPGSASILRETLLVPPRERISFAKYGIISFSRSIFVGSFTGAH